jgi:hypothetical protein
VEEEKIIKDGDNNRSAEVQKKRRTYSEEVDARELDRI